jgi:hypothetical protein
MSRLKKKVNSVADEKLKGFGLNSRVFLDFRWRATKVLIVNLKRNSKLPPSSKRLRFIDFLHQPVLVVTHSVAWKLTGIAEGCKLFFLNAVFSFRIVRKNMSGNHVESV